jgi:hypothetical protein
MFIPLGITAPLSRPADAQDYANRLPAHLCGYYRPTREMTAADLGLYDPNLCDCGSGLGEWHALGCQAIAALRRPRDGLPKIVHAYGRKWRVIEKDCVPHALEPISESCATDAPYSFWLGASG